MSGSQNALERAHVITAASMASTITQTIPINLKYIDKVAIQLNFTGTPTGAFTINASVDHLQDQSGNVLNAGTFIPMSFSTPPVASGAAGNIILDITTAVPYIQIIYTPSGGTGTLDAYITGKSI